MLFGYREIVDNRIASIVPAAETIAEYDEWVGKITVQDPHPNFEDYTASSLMDHLTRGEFKGYKRSVLVVYHTSEQQRDAFFEEWQIKPVQSQPARDRQKDMIWLKKQEEEAAQVAVEKAAAEAEGNEYSDKTIEEIYGLVEHDPWDKRTDKEKEFDEANKKQMKELQKKGNISEDSFGSAQEQRKARAEQRGEKAKKANKGVVGVTDIRVKQNESGEISIDNVLARKWGGEIDTALAESNAAAQEAKRQEQLKGQTVFSPEDFAAVLRGDGSSDAMGIPADKDSNKRMRQPGKPRPTLSDHAEAARKKHQEEQAAKKAEAEAKQRIEDDVLAKDEHDNDVFKGCDLQGDQSIKLADLPKELQDIFQRSNIKATTFPLKDVPFNSLIGDRALFPDTLNNEEAKLGTTHNLEIEGSISIGINSVHVMKKEDKDQPGWVVYTWRKIKDPSIGQDTNEESTEDPIAISIIRVR